MQAKIKEFIEKIGVIIQRLVIGFLLLLMVILVTVDVTLHFPEYFYKWSEDAAALGELIDSFSKNEFVENPDDIHNQTIFREFLTKTKELKAYSSHLEKKPNAFISYAWGDENSRRESIATKKIQDRLLMLQGDLEFLGVETFLDLKHMHGNVRDTIKKNLEKADFFILIGNPFLKRKATGQRLFFLNHFDPKLLPASGHCVVAVEARKDYMVYLVEERNVKETLALPLKLDGIPWDTINPGVQEGRLSEKTNAFLEQILAKFKNVPRPAIANIQFECGMVMDKAYQNPTRLIPLLFAGNYTAAFPAVIRETFIRDFRDESQYFIQMSSLGNPVGIIPELFPELISNQDYIHLVQDLKNNLK